MPHLPICGMIPLVNPLGIVCSTNRMPPPPSAWCGPSQFQVFKLPPHLSWAVAALQVLPDFEPQHASATAVALAALSEAAGLSSDGGDSGDGKGSGDGRGGGDGKVGGGAAARQRMAAAAAVACEDVLPALLELLWPLLLLSQQQSLGAHGGWRGGADGLSGSSVDGRNDGASELGPQVLANMLWALGVLRAAPPAEWMADAAAAAAGLAHRMEPRHVSAAAWGFAALGYHPGQEWLACVLAATAPGLGAGGPRGAATLLRALGVLGYEPPVPLPVRMPPGGEAGPGTGAPATGGR
eukprot:315035-Chlamydomonas_euryale.AAC.1